MKHIFFAAISVFFLPTVCEASTLISTEGNTVALKQKSQKTKIPKNKKKTVKKTPINGIDIDAVMNYPIPHVLDRYKKDYGVSHKTAKLHEKELKRWFIVGAEYADEPLDMMSHEVDNLWHTWLLFTREYATFCHSMFGHFIHHCPKIEEEMGSKEA